MLYHVTIEYWVRAFRSGKLLCKTRVISTYASDGIEAMEKVAKQTRGEVVDFFSD